MGYSKKFLLSFLSCLVMTCMNMHTMQDANKWKLVILDDGLDADGNTSLHRAAWINDTEAIHWLVREGANQDIKNKKGMTPLHIAAHFGCVDAINALVVGANKEAVDVKWCTPLHFAANKGHVEAAQVLVLASADKDAKNQEGATPLHVAVLNDQDEVIEKLVAIGVDKEAVDNQGNTPLHYAAILARVKSIHALLAAGVNKNAVNNAGFTAAQKAKTVGVANLITWPTSK